jgi:uncharacterized membrane protein YhaH (DUF805 family)
MSSPVFISYRRSDSQHATGRLFSRLAPRYLAEADIFMDVEAIAAGADFKAALDDQLRHCKVCLVMIGPDWLATGTDGKRRVDSEGDFVRMEAATALARRDIRVIPVLVDNARMPSEAELPEPLKALSRLNAVHLTHERFDADGDALAGKVLSVLDRPLDREMDILKLLFSFKGTIGRKRFWLGWLAIAACYFVVAAAVSLAAGVSIADFILTPLDLPKNVQIIEQVATTWIWWPILALAWKRIADLGHGWDLFIPIVCASILEIGLGLAGYKQAAEAVSLICIILLIVLGAIKGTRFIAHNA